jgi:hypothetical protein
MGFLWEFLPRGYLKKIVSKFFDKTFKDYFFNRPGQNGITNWGVTGHTKLTLFQWERRGNL